VCYFFTKTVEPEAGGIHRGSGHAAARPSQGTGARERMGIAEPNPDGFSAAATPRAARETTARSPLRGVPLLAALAALAVVVAPLPHTTAQPLPTPDAGPAVKRVVLLFSDETTLPGNVLALRGLQAGLANDPAIRPEFYYEFLDLTRFQGDAYERRLTEVLRLKYLGHRPDLLVAFSTPALAFAAEWGPFLFPDVPLVYVGATRTAVSAFGPRLKATGALAELEFRATVQAAVRMLPRTRRFVVVGGATRTDGMYLDIVRASVVGLEREVSFEYLAGLPMAELLDRVARLPRDAVILYVSIFRDGAGQAFRPTDALALVAARSPVPVFGPTETYLGRGIVGGDLLDWEKVGLQAAGLARRVLHGADPSTLPPSGAGLSSWIFDARELDRWGIRESALPPGSEVRFRGPSLWREHPWGAAAALALILVEAVLIGTLAFERRLRRQAQQQQWLLSAIVESSNDAVAGLDADGRIVSWNRGAESLFGYTADEIVGRDGNLLVPPSLREEAHAAFRAVLAGGAAPPFETIRLKKGGAKVHVSVSDSPIRDTRGRIVGVSSAQRDITQTKLAEQTLREREEHLSLATAAANLAPWVWYVKEDAIWVTESAYRLYGLDPAMAADRPAFGVETVVRAAPPDDRDAIREGLRRAIEERTSYQAEHRIVWPNGETRWVLATARCEYEDDGSPRRLLGVSIDITERKLAEQRLGESEARYRLIADNARDVIWTMNLDGRFTYVSPSVTQLLGFTVEEVMGQTIGEALTQESLRQVRPEFETVRTTGEKLRSQWELDQPRKDGSIVHTEVSTAVLRDEEGEPVGILGVSRDITERRHMEEARAEQARFESLFSDLSARFVNIPVDLVDQAIEDAQRRLCEVLRLDLSALWQWSSGNIGSQTLTHLFRPGGGPPVPDRMDARAYFPWCLHELTEGRPIRVSSLDDLPPEAERDKEVWRQFGIKSTLTLPLTVGLETTVGSLSFSTMEKEREWPDALVKRLQPFAEVFANALARKRYEWALRESEERLRSVFAAIAEGVLLYGADGKVITCNDSAERILGRTRSELEGTSPSEHHHDAVREDGSPFPPDEHPSTVTLRTGQPCAGVVMGFHRPAGELVWVSLNSQLASPGGAGAQGAVVVTMADISERRRDEAERRQLQRELTHVGRVTMMGELTSSLAHELRQPLTAILANAQAAQRMLSGGEPELEELREIVNDIAADDDRAGEIISRLRALLQKGQTEFQMFDLNTMVRDVADLVHSDTVIKNVSLTLDLAPEIPPVRGDRIQLQQVILNLMINSIDAMGAASGDDRRLAVRTEGREQEVRVAVQDSGPGIPASALDRVFEPFFTTKADGLGMGLAIARSILRAHDGRIWAENNATGGATFTLVLPIAR